MEIKVPDLGDYSDVEVIEVHIAPGDVLSAEAPLLTLETDKATMDVPAPFECTVASVLVAVGDRVSTGSVVATAEPTAESEPEPQLLDSAPVSVPDPPSPTATAPLPASSSDNTAQRVTPLVRRLARELEIDLDGVAGTGPRGRVTKQDLLAAIPRPQNAGGEGIPAIPEVDFAKFGPVHRVPLSRIKRLSGPHLHRSWLNVPHVTHVDEADITELDEYRRLLDGNAADYRVTLLSFLLKAAAATLHDFPEVNSSLSGDELVLKDYVHIGVAVDTPDGLVVPVIRDVDRKGVIALSRELGDLSTQAREGRLAAGDMQGATFTISSLGGIGGTAFTPIVNAPEVAILGVVRAKTAPVWDGHAFNPRLMLPLCLSYDHRVIDGALAARFTRSLADRVEDVRRLVL